MDSAPNSQPSPPVNQDRKPSELPRDEIRRRRRELVMSVAVILAIVAMILIQGRVVGFSRALPFGDSLLFLSLNGHLAVLLRDGTVKVWGRRYEAEGPHDPPQPLSGIVALASNHDRIAVCRDFEARALAKLGRTVTASEASRVPTGRPLGG